MPSILNDFVNPTHFTWISLHILSLLPSFEPTQRACFFFQCSPLDEIYWRKDPEYEKQKTLKSQNHQETKQCHPHNCWDNLYSISLIEIPFIFYESFDQEPQRKGGIGMDSTHHPVCNLSRRQSTPISETNQFTTTDAVAWL